LQSQNNPTPQTFPPSRRCMVFPPLLFVAPCPVRPFSFQRPQNLPHPTLAFHSVPFALKAVFDQVQLRSIVMGGRGCPRPPLFSFSPIRAARDLWRSGGCFVLSPPLFHPLFPHPAHPHHFDPGIGNGFFPPAERLICAARATISDSKTPRFLFLFCS